MDAARYRVRVMDRSGVYAGEWTLSSRRVPVSDSGWKRYVQETTNNAVAMASRSVGKLEAQMGTKIKGVQPPRYVVPDRLRVLPAVNFGDGVRRMHGYGNLLWIPVHVTDPPSIEYWDVVDLTRGARVVTISLPLSHRLVHVTARGAYVVYKDEDDLERILLYRAPPMR